MNTKEYATFCYNTIELDKVFMVDTWIGLFFFPSLSVSSLPIYPIYSPSPIRPSLFSPIFLLSPPSSHLSPFIFLPCPLYSIYPLPFIVYTFVSRKNTVTRRERPIKLFLFRDCIIAWSVRINCLSSSIVTFHLLTCSEKTKVLTY